MAIRPPDQPARPVAYTSPCFCHTLVAFGACDQGFLSGREGVVRMDTSPRNRTRSPVEDVLLSAPERGAASSFDNAVSAILPEKERRNYPDASKFEIPVEELRRLANNRGAPIRSSSGRRLLRTFFGFLIAASVGVLATVAWQHNGDVAKKTISSWTVVSLDWLRAKRPPDLDTTAEKDASTVSGRTPGNDAPAAFPQTASELEPRLIQKLKSIAANLAALKQSVDELSAKQERLSSKIEDHKAADQQIRPKTPPPRKRIPTAPPRPDAESVSPQPLPAPPASSLPPAASIPRPTSVVGEGQ